MVCFLFLCRGATLCFVKEWVGRGENFFFFVCSFYMAAKGWAMLARKSCFVKRERRDFFFKKRKTLS